LDEVRKAHLKAVEDREGAADIERNLFGFVQERCLELTAAKQRHETSLIRECEARIELSFATNAGRRYCQMLCTGGGRILNQLL
jgi:uncharacterized protein YjiK